MSAAADRSRSQEATTLPRRHSSARSVSEVVLIVLRIAQRRRLGVDRVLALADIGRAQNAEPLGIGGHDSVLDPVVDHLDEVAGTVRPAVQIAALGGPTVGLP